MRTRRKFTSEFKTKVVLDTLSERKSLAEIAKKYSILPVQISTWKKQFLDGCSMVFDNSESSAHEDRSEEIRGLYEVIGKQQVQLDFLKKSIIEVADIVERRQLIDKQHELSMAQQCKLLDVHRSGLYYEPVVTSSLNLELMRLIDEQHLKYTFWGVPKMHTWLVMDKGYQINYKRVERLMRLMGLQSIAPGPHTSRKQPGAYIYPYLLKALDINHVNHVWETDITYIPMRRGYMFLMAILDVFSRYVVGWDVSSTMDAQWCTSVLRTAIDEHGPPEISNTDQGSQFTSDVWIGTLKSHEVKISMDGKGRALDNIFVERLWRSVKHEHVYLSPADDGKTLYSGLEGYFNFYHLERRLDSLGHLTPCMVFKGF